MTNLDEITENNFDHIFNMFVTLSQSSVFEYDMEAFIPRK